MSNVKFAAVAASALLFGMAAPVSSYAGGGSSSAFGNSGVAVLAHASSHLRFATDHTVLDTNSWADAQTLADPGKIIGRGEAGNYTTLTSFRGGACNCDGGVRYVENSESRSKIYAKGGNLLIKSRAKNHLQIYVDGELALINDQIAIAQARQTVLGAQASAYAATTTSFEAKGYVRLENGNVAQTSASVSN
jgi:hypothetical protein